MMTYYAVHVLKDTASGRQKKWEAQMLWTRKETGDIATTILGDDSVIFTEVWACEDKAPHNSRMLERIAR